MTYCGNCFISSIILLKKNVFCAVVLHLGLKSFCECPLNLYVSQVRLKKSALATLPFLLSILYTSIKSPHSNVNVKLEVNTKMRRWHVHH